MEKIDLDLIKCVIKTKRDLENATKNFEVAEEELIDYYSYQIKASKANAIQWSKFSITLLK